MKRAVIAAVLSGALLLTGCGTDTDDECRDNDTNASLVLRPGPGGGARGGGSRPAGPKLVKPAPAKGSKPSGSSKGSKPKAPKIDLDDDCEQQEGNER